MKLNNRTHLNLEKIQGFVLALHYLPNFATLMQCDF